MLYKEWNLGETRFAYKNSLFYFIIAWRSNYLILFLTLFIDFRILFIFWVTTFVVMMRVVLIQVMVLMDRFDSFRFVQGLVLKINFSFSKSVSCSVVKRGRFLSEIAIISYTICFIFYSLKKFGNLICDRHVLPFYQAR